MEEISPLEQTRASSLHDPSSLQVILADPPTWWGVLGLQTYSICPPEKKNKIVLFYKVFIYFPF